MNEKDFKVLENIFLTSTSSEELFDAFDTALKGNIGDLEIYKILLANPALSIDEIEMYVKILSEKFPSMKYDLEHIPNIEGGNLIYSMWRGYEKKKGTKEFIDYLKSRNFTVNHIHSSGHADLPTLEKMVNAVAPKKLVPIHTFNSSDYKNPIFS